MMHNLLALLYELKTERIPVKSCWKCTSIVAIISIIMLLYRQWLHVYAYVYVCACMCTVHLFLNKHWHNCNAYYACHFDCPRTVYGLKGTQLKYRHEYISVCIEWNYKNGKLLSLNWRFINPWWWQIAVFSFTSALENYLSDISSKIWLDQRAETCHWEERHKRCSVSLKR